MKREKTFPPFENPPGAGVDRNPPVAPAPSPPRSPEGRPHVTYRIRFAPSPDMLRRGKNPASLLDELRGLGHCRVVAQTYELQPMEEFDPVLCNAYLDVLLTTFRGIEDIRSVLGLVDEGCGLDIHVHRCAEP